LQEIFVKGLMTASVKTVHPSTPFSEALEIMKESRLSCIVVTDDEVPVGIVTERDVVRLFSDLLAERINPTQKIEKVMTVPPITIEETNTLVQAVVIAKSNRIRHLPVVDAQGKLVGLVTQSDLVSAHFHIIQKQSEILDREVAARTHEIKELNAKLVELSLEDVMLHIGNRRAMEIDLNFTNEMSRRYKRPYSVILFDVDHFKNYNDFYGHGVGDAALKAVSAHLKNTARKSDRLYRYGGEEILLLLPETSADGAQILANRLVEGMAQCGIPHERSPLKVLTLSAGVSDRSQWTTDVTWRQVVQAADEALYQAKKAGRNQVAVSDQSDGEKIAAPDGSGVSG